MVLHGIISQANCHIHKKEKKKKTKINLDSSYTGGMIAM